MFKVDNQFKERPPCAVPSCNELAMILYSGKFVCGKCAASMSSKINQYVFDRFVKENEVNKI